MNSSAFHVEHGDERTAFHVDIPANIAGFFAGFGAGIALVAALLSF